MFSSSTKNRASVSDDISDLFSRQRSVTRSLSTAVKLYTGNCEEEIGCYCFYKFVTEDKNWKNSEKASNAKSCLIVKFVIAKPVRLSQLARSFGNSTKQCVCVYICVYLGRSRAIGLGFRRRVGAKQQCSPQMNTRENKEKKLLDSVKRHELK